MGKHGHRGVIVVGGMCYETLYYYPNKNSTKINHETNNNHRSR